MSTLGLWVLAGGAACGGSQARPGDVSRNRDPAYDRWMSRMTPVEVDVEADDTRVMMGGEVQQLELATAPGSYLTSWVTLSFEISTETQQPPVSAPVASTLGDVLPASPEGWPHYACSEVLLRVPGQALPGSEAHYHAVGYVEGVGVTERVEAGFPPAELSELLARGGEITGSLCGMPIEIDDDFSASLANLVRSGSSDPRPAPPTVVNPATAPPAAARPARRGARRGAPR